MRGQSGPGGHPLNRLARPAAEHPAKDAAAEIGLMSNHQRTLGQEDGTVVATHEAAPSPPRRGRQPPSRTRRGCTASSSSAAGPAGSSWSPGWATGSASAGRRT